MQLRDRSYPDQIVAFAVIAILGLLMIPLKQIVFPDPPSSEEVEKASQKLALAEQKMNDGLASVAARELAQTFEVVPKDRGPVAFEQKRLQVATTLQKIEEARATLDADLCSNLDKFAFLASISKTLVQDYARAERSCPK